MAVTYKCPKCGSSMEYNGELGKMACDHCGNTMTVEELEQANGVQEEFIKDHEERTYKTTDFKEYHCPNCGAQLLTDEHTSATICSFCGSPGLLEDRLTGAVEPTQVIPFRITREQAVVRFRKWTKNGMLTPRDFTSTNTIEKITGMYVPFWLYDYDTDVRMTAHCTRVRVSRKGDMEYTYTDHYEVYRDVSCQYEKIPADASEKMEDGLMDSLEPYQYQELKEFEMPYLSGYLSEKYSYTAEQLQERARSRARNYAFSEARGTIAGYSTVNVVDRWIGIKEKGEEYVLLPVWMLNYRYKGRNYQFTLNGQTGKIIGKLPVSSGKAAAWFGTILAVVFVAASLIGGLL